MTERPAPPSAGPATPAEPPRPAASGVGTSASAPAPARAAAPTESPADTAVRPGFAERLQAKLSSDKDKSADQGASSAPARETRPSSPRGPRRARLRLTRIDPWSVMKTSFLLAIAFGVVTVVAVAMIWQVLGVAGVWDSINETLQGTIGGDEIADFDIQDYVGTSRVLGFTMLVAAVDVVLITTIATLGAFLYNMSAALLGGVEVTLAEDND